jgi:predicted MFS family arabinose efflux permease
MLLVYQHQLRLGPQTVQGLFGVYVLGLLPGLFLGGPASDRFGRRAITRSGLVLSGCASLLLLLGEWDQTALYAGRMVAGVATGSVFSVGTAWLREISPDQPKLAARKAAVVMTAGFGIGPLAAGALGQWIREPLVLPYLPHLLLTAAVLPSLWIVRNPEPARPDLGQRPIVTHHSYVPRLFKCVVVPLAPWVFAAPTVAIAFLPAALDASDDAVAFSAAVAALTALAGLLIQTPLRKIEERGVIYIGFGLAAAGLIVAALTVIADELLLVLVAGVILGGSYGACLAAGVRLVNRIAPSDRLATLTAAFYGLTYCGFIAPFFLAILERWARPSLLLFGMAALAVCSAGWVAVQQLDDTTAPNATISAEIRPLR